MTSWCLVKWAVIWHLFYLLYCIHFKLYCEHRIINFFMGFLKVSVNVSLFLSALNIKLHIFLWIKRSIWICFTDGKIILTATRKTFVVKYLVLQSASQSYATGCQRPMPSVCSTESSAVLHSPMLNGTWKKCVTHLEICKVLRQLVSCYTGTLKQIPEVTWNSSGQCLRV